MRTLGSLALQGVAGLFTPIGLHQLSKINFTLSDHTYAYAISKLDRTKARLSNRELAVVKDSPMSSSWYMTEWKGTSLPSRYRSVGST